MSGLQFAINSCKNHSSLNKQLLCWAVAFKRWSCPAEHIRSRDATLRWRCGSNLSTKGLRDRARNVLPLFLSFDPRRGRTDEGAAAATKYAPQQRRVSTLGMRTKIRRGKDGEGGREGRRGGREMSLFSNVDLLASPMKRMDGASLKSQEELIPDCKSTF